MPSSDEQMRKRQEKREAMRRRQQAQARRMRLTLLLALVVLGLCGAGLWYLTKGSQDPADLIATEPPIVTEAPTEQTKPVSPVNRDPITKIHIRAAGDLNVTDSVVAAGIAARDYDYGGVFKDVAALLADADLTVMNFEGNACGEPYGTATSSAPQQLLESLRSCGVDLLQMANSCTINNGLNGMNATLQSIRAAGIEPLGAYTSDAEFRASKGYTIVEAKGIKVAVVAFTKGLGGRGMPAGNENLVNLLYEDYDSDYQKVAKDKIESILKSAEAEKPDLTIAMVHWGSEYNDDISSTQKQIVSLMQKRGVDIILGTHPHTLQPIEYNPGKGTLVAYSLGDFFGDATRGATNYSIILDMEITKDASTGTTKVTGYSYTPIYTVRPSECPDEKQRVVRIEQAIQAYSGNYLDSITSACKDSMMKALTRIEERLVMPKEAE